MPREVKCIFCETKEPFSEELFTSFIHVTESGKEYKKIIHHKCLNKYQEKEAFKDKEQQELDELVRVAGEIHEAPKPPNLAHQLPRNWYHVVQDFRNGTQRYTRTLKKRYKKGVPYPIIIEAYKMSKDAIRWAKMDKQFRDMASECRYALAIVSSKIPDALIKADREKHMDKVNKVKEQEMLDNMKHERETVYQNKKSKYDISDLFD